ncbi:MAG: histidinol dehydrogenase [Chloroflexi bacterium]|nr:histidinol dehydrogenase [Chloroflexota bacterium]
MGALRLYEDWQQARQSLLRRRGLASEDVPDSLRQGMRRVFGEELTPEAGVSRILADIRQRGDVALREWTARIDGLAVDSSRWRGTEYQFEVPRHAWEQAFALLPADLAKALNLAAERIRSFHSRQPVSSWTTTDLGGVMGQRVTPLARVGVYVPGGTAPLPSSLLMTVIPARVAGVREVVVCTPPDRHGTPFAPLGRRPLTGEYSVPQVILAAAHIAGADRLFSLGGAQAIAALAYGTEAVPRVDKIVGAGGLFVTLAKRQVYGEVGLDTVAGPTETMIIADDHANASWVACDLLAQAEHDVLATAILLTPSRRLAEAVQVEVDRQLARLERKQEISAALTGQGGIVLTPDLHTAFLLADEFAPEHLCLSVRNAEEWVEMVHNAGGIFVGEHSFEVLGDYVAGPSHVMPTGGTARFASPVNVLDFVKITSVIALDAGIAQELCQSAACLAHAESLTAHATAAERRRGSGGAQE